MSFLVIIRIGELGEQVDIAFDCLDEIAYCAGEAVALAAFLPWGFSAGDDLDCDSPAAATDPFDAHLTDTRILGVEEMGCLKPGRVRDVRHPVWEAVGRVVNC